MENDRGEPSIDHTFELSKVWGPRRSGNTFRAITYTLLNASAYGRVYYYVTINPNYAFGMAVSMAMQVDGFTANRSRREITTPNGSVIRFVRSVGEHHLRGLRPEPEIIYDKD